MRRESVGRWSWLLAAILISALGLAGCGGGGGGGGGVPVSAFTRVGGNENSGDFGVDLSQTGRYVAFSSAASDLTGTGNDNNNRNDIFVYDRQTGDITVASRKLPQDAFNTKVANADGDSIFPAISDDGSKVAFESRANNLVSATDPPNAFSDIFIHNRDLNTTERVSVVPAGLGGGPTNGDSFKPSISGNGQFVAFYSFATNLVAGDNNGVADVFLYDRTLATTTRISGAAGGFVFGHSVSDDGTRVAFQSPPSASGGNIFVWISGTVRQLTTDGTSSISGISSNGQFVVFDSDAALVAGDNNGVSDVYVYSLVDNTITRVSLAPGGAQFTGPSATLGHRAISDDGNLVVFESGTAGSINHYVRNRSAGTTTAMAALTGTFVSEGVTISGDGSTAALVTDDPLVAGDTLGLFDVFIMAVP